MYFIIIIYGIILARVGEIVKKLFITLLSTVLLLSGCTLVSDKSISDVFETILYVDNNLSNTYMNGYSFYLPQGLKITDKNDFNLIIEKIDEKYYLFIDTIAYHYNTDNHFKEVASHFYSKKFSHNGKNGYVDIILNNDEYFITIMYNYAKIETYVKKRNFNEAIMKISQILSTVKYNDAIIDSYVGGKGMVYQEEKFNIFGTDTENDNFLKYESEYGTYKEQINKNDDTINVDEVIE